MSANAVFIRLLISALILTAVVLVIYTVSRQLKETTGARCCGE